MRAEDFAKPAITESRKSLAMRFRPMNGRCVVRRLDPEKISAGGIILPDTAQKKSELGQVLEVCDEWDRDGKTYTSKLEPGDIVLSSKYVGEEFTVDGRLKVLLIKEEDILSVLDGYTPPV